jgi:hypothetical protein
MAPRLQRLKRHCCSLTLATIRGSLQMSSGWFYRKLAERIFDANQSAYARQALDSAGVTASLPANQSTVPDRQLPTLDVTAVYNTLQSETLCGWSPCCLQATCMLPTRSFTGSLVTHAAESGLLEGNPGLCFYPRLCNAGFCFAF